METSTLNPNEQTNNQTTPPPAETEPKTSANKTGLWLGIITLLLLTTTAAGYFYYQNQQLKKLAIITPKPYPIETKPTSTPIPDTTVGWQTYTNTFYGFSFKYPQGVYVEGTPTSPSVFIDAQPINLPEGWGMAQATAIEITKANLPYDKQLNEFKKILIPSSITETTLPTPQIGTRVDGVGSEGPMENNKVTAVIIQLPNKTVLNMGFDHRPNFSEKLFTQILSTFQFQEPSIKPTSKLTATPKPKPSPTAAPKTTTYQDADMGYSITYPTTWTFRRTYGQDIPKVGQTDILDAFDLHSPAINYSNLSLAGSLLDAHGLDDIESWIAQYDLNYPKDATKTTITFAGRPAIKYVYSNSPDRTNETIYFLANNHAYRLMYWEKGGISETFHEVVNSFRP